VCRKYLGPKTALNLLFIVEGLPTDQKQLAGANTTNCHHWHGNKVRPKNVASAAGMKLQVGTRDMRLSKMPERYPLPFDCGARGGRFEQAV
jgi:hypothetical protein